MTAIAYRRGTMAADSLTVFGDIKAHDPNKVRVVRGHLVGVAGADTPSDAAFDRWFFGKKSGPTTPLAGDFTALVITPEKKILLIDSRANINPLNGSFWAIGAGADVCLGAMDLGASARRAVEAAIRWREGCGGRVYTVRLP